jgi:hypothetical protein
LHVATRPTTAPVHRAVGAGEQLLLAGAVAGQRRKADGDGGVLVAGPHSQFLDALADALGDAPY